MRSKFYKINAAYAISPGSLNPLISDNSAGTTPSAMFFSSMTTTKQEHKSPPFSGLLCFEQTGY
jgi:hypothetical protein